MLNCFRKKKQNKTKHPLVEDEIANSYYQKQLYTNSTPLENFHIEPTFQPVLNTSP